MSIINARGRIDFFEENLEVLTEWEIPQLPCEQATSVCVFKAYDANGNLGLVRLPGLKNVP